MANNGNNDFIRASLALAAAQICQSLGWHSMHRSSHDILTDILERYLKQVSKTAANYSQNYCRTVPNLNDISLAFEQLGIEIHELQDYVHQVESQPLSHNVPEVPVPNKQDLLSYSVDGQFPAIVETKENEEMDIDIKEEVHESEVAADETDENKTDRPKDLVICRNSVESPPPYSPLEPKSLNYDAQCNMDLTRPGLIVTTPKGYTPTLTTQAPTVGIASFTNSVAKILPSPEIKSLISETTTSKPVPIIETKSETAKVKHKDKKTEKTQSMMSPKSSSKTLKSSSPKLSKNKRSVDLLSPKSQRKSSKSPKPKIPTAGITDFVKTSKLTERTIIPKKIIKPIDREAVALKEELPDNSYKITEPETVPYADKTLELPDSPPHIEPSPPVILSPIAVTKTSPRSPTLSETAIKHEVCSPERPSKTVVFPKQEPISTHTIHESSPPTLFSPKDMISPNNGGISSFSTELEKPVLLSPVPISMPVLQKHSDDLDITGNSTETEIDILSYSQNELNPSENIDLSPVVLLHHSVTEEKKKKKKKKSDKDKEGRKQDGSKEKKEKKKKREEKEKIEKKESVAPIPRITLKMGSETISDSAPKLSKLLITSEATSSFSSNDISPSPVSMKSSSKKSKKVSKQKEVKSGGFYVETLTNTSSSIGADVYYCPGCGLADDGSPMIGCDSCDLWYHWPCVNVTTAPDDDAQWYCPKCSSAPPAKKKKKKKKRDTQ